MVLQYALNQCETNSDEIRTLNLRIIRSVNSLKLSSSNESASSSTTCDNLDKSYSSTQHKHHHKLNSLLTMTYHSGFAYKQKLWQKYAINLPKYIINSHHFYATKLSEAFQIWHQNVCLSIHQHITNFKYPVFTSTNSSVDCLIQLPIVEVNLNSTFCHFIRTD